MMIMRLALLVTLCATLLGCGAQTPPITAPWQNSRIEIRADVQTLPLDTTLNLYFDGDRVISGTTQLFEGSAQNLTGTWKGQRVLARVTREQAAILISTRVDVFINGNLVEILRM